MMTARPRQLVRWATDDRSGSRYLGDRSVQRAPHAGISQQDWAQFKECSPVCE